MNIFGTEFDGEVQPERRVETGSETPPEPVPIQTLRGGDASDIVPRERLRAAVTAHVDSDGNTAQTARTIRGEFASLQRVLESRIARYDAALEVVFEDDEVIVYRLETRRDFRTIFEFCEIERRLFRDVIVELMRAIAADRTATVPEFPLVVRKPTAFRAGERHALSRRSRSSDHDD